MTLEERIEALEKKIGIYKSVPEEFIKKRWRAEPGGEYYFAMPMGEPAIATDNNHGYNDYRYQRGNYFKTKEEAELYDKKMLITQKVKDIAIRLGEPTEDDWGDSGVAKNYLYIIYKEKSCGYSSDFIAKTQGTIYCLDSNFLNVCLEEIGEEDLKLILLDL